MGASVPQNPVRNVDWCSAFAYCKWRGKRLCTGLVAVRDDGGGGVDPSTDEWGAACSSGGATVWPYGNSYEEKTCNGLDNGLRNVWTVGDGQSCRPGNGPRNMSGNVAEWVETCDRQDCSIRGGSYLSGPADLRCSSPRFERLGNNLPDVGIRCCE
jgi:formylglycine-generating enzyme required for sulfatase activity